MRISFSLPILMIAFAMPSAAECTAHSGPNTAALVELYTSEGCDSCPPADRWLSGLADSARPGALLVPIAFHVDYWDYLGWKDRFGDARYTERQRDFARAAGARAVYTPQVVLGGRDFSAWRLPFSSKAFAGISERPARAKIDITTAAGPSARVSASLAAGQRADDLALFVAITQNGLVSQVKAGENRGETLRHDFVVRELKTMRGWSAGEAATIESNASFSPKPDWNLEKMNVVAFVQNVRTGEVLQALAAPMCR